MTWVTCLLTHLPYPHDYKKHAYLAVPEVSVLKEGEGTPVEARSEAMDHTTPPDVTESVHAVASTRSATAAESQPQPTHPLPPHPVSHNLSSYIWVTLHTEYEGQCFFLDLWVIILTGSEGAGSKGDVPRKGDVPF